MKETVGELITKGRESNNLSMRQLAEKANVSHTEISRIESGEREIPNPKTLRKISQYIGINYNDLMYAAGLGAKVSPLNPYLLEHYANLKGTDLDEALIKTKGSIENNEVVIESLKKSSEEKGISDDKKSVLLETIEDLEYQNETNKEIIRLLESNVIKERLKNAKKS